MNDYAFWGMLNNMSAAVIADMLEEIDNEIMGDIAVKEAQRIIEEGNDKE